MEIEAEGFRVEFCPRKVNVFHIHEHAPVLCMLHKVFEAVGEDRDGAHCTALHSADCACSREQFHHGRHVVGFEGRLSETAR